MQGTISLQTFFFFFLQKPDRYINNSFMVQITEEIQMYDDENIPTKAQTY